MLGGPLLPPLEDLWSLKDFLSIHGLWRLSQTCGNFRGYMVRAKLGPAWQVSMEASALCP